MIANKSLSRFRVDDEPYLSDSVVNREISRAFNEMRAYEIYLDSDVVERLREGDPPELYREHYFDQRNSVIDRLAGDDQVIRDRLMQDNRLTARLVIAVSLLYQAAARVELPSVVSRRFVIIKELPGRPTITHRSEASTVLAHIGAGPEWTEIPTIYLGLKTFDAVAAHRKLGRDELFQAFVQLLAIEERAVETGYIHDEIQTPDVSKALTYLLDEVVAISRRFEVEEEETVPWKKPAPFKENQRQNILRELDARGRGDELNFDYARCMKAVKGLERLARRYKRSADQDSLREVVRLLVSASGHDIHEVRDYANIILERVLAPKEFDAPLATKFINTYSGTEYTFTFDLGEEKGNHFLAIYNNESMNGLFLEKDISRVEIPLRPGEEPGNWTATYRFDRIGHYDFIVMRQKKKNATWLNLPGASGRVNVLPDLKGEIILEIFPDIHGHTRIYWHDRNGHTGLVYNENGEVIRLGRFSDIKVHLEDIRKRYRATSLYLLGVQKRGQNRQDWDPGATSPSPFSPMSLIDIEPFLGGEEEFVELVQEAHRMDIRVIVDVVPHINRSSDHLPDKNAVMTYNHEGNLTPRASTDGRYGSWDDGKLLNYRQFEVWEWLTESILTLIDRFDIDGIRFDSAHAVPIMMKKNNYPRVYNRARSHEEMVEGNIIVNDREDEHLITTGYYDSACRDLIAVPFHYYLMLRVERKLREHNKPYFVNLAECYWGHERFLARTGLIPYNSSLFKVCENIIHGTSDVREIYHIYDNYYPSTLPEGTVLLGILGNHDERRALNTFGHRGLRAAVGLTSFMSSVIMDYEGSAEGEGWKVYLDNIYVNWNQFEYAAHRSLESFYGEWYTFHRSNPGLGYLLWSNNNMVAASMKFSGDTCWVGAFNFSDYNQSVALQFDNPRLPLGEEDSFRLVDPLYSAVTRGVSYYTGKELKTSRVSTIVSYTDRVKLLKFERVSREEFYREFLTDSFSRLATIDDTDAIESSFAFMEIARRCDDYRELIDFLLEYLVEYYWINNRPLLELAIKRAVFYLYKHGYITVDLIKKFQSEFQKEKDERIVSLGIMLVESNRRGSMVFMSAEAEPFSKSGGLANVVYELPRELVRMGEKVYVITGYYHHGDEKAVQKLRNAVKRYNVKYTGKNVRFNIHEYEYEVGVHYGEVDGVGYFLLDHYEFFDGLYWGITSVEKLRRRIAFARAAAEVILTFDLKPHYTYTNDAYAGIFNGIVRGDEYYSNHPVFMRNTFLHIIHNGGWQYFDAYHRWERGRDLFTLFNLPMWKTGDFCDPLQQDKISCMATGIRLANRTITVSPSYARQIEYASDGLEHILHDVIGISNAIGSDFREKIEERFRASGFVEEWYPRLLDHISGNSELKKVIEKRYPEIMKGYDDLQRIKDLEWKEILVRLSHKLMLQLSRGLKVDPDVILFTMIHRISEQKGFQLILDASEGLVKTLNYQMIIGGAVSSGDQRGEEIAQGLSLLTRYYPDNINVIFGFQDVSIPLLGTDLFGMPSMHEPGGISQLEAFAAGSFVVARATGGLRDTVFPLRSRGDDVEGNGFLFTDFSPGSFYDAMERAAKFMKNNDDRTVLKGRRNAEKSVYYWDRPARQYIEAVYSLTETIRIIEP